MRTLTHRLRNLPIFALLTLLGCGVPDGTDCTTPNGQTGKFDNGQCTEHWRPNFCPEGTVLTDLDGVLLCAKDLRVCDPLKPILGDSVTFCEGGGYKLRFDLIEIDQGFTQPGCALKGSNFSEKTAQIVTRAQINQERMDTWYGIIVREHVEVLIYCIMMR